MTTFGFRPSKSLALSIDAYVQEKKSDRAKVLTQIVEDFFRDYRKEKRVGGQLKKILEQMESFSGIGEIDFTALDVLRIDVDNIKKMLLIIGGADPESVSAKLLKENFPEFFK